MKRKYDQARFLAVLQSLQDPVLSKIIEAERLAEGPESEKQREKFIAGLENMPIKQERINLLMLVDYTCGKSALAIKMQTKSLRDFLQVYNHCVPAASRYSPEAIEAAAKKLQVKLQSAAKNSALINLIFTYYGISDQELAEYLKFYDSDNAKWILRATEEDLGLAWGIAAERAGKAAVRLPASENPEKK